VQQFPTTLDLELTQNTSYDLITKENMLCLTMQLG